MLKIMTPGPTQVRENVRLARSKITTNPDVDLNFCEEYKQLCDNISKILKTKNETLVLAGEGILGLEAACASLTEPGDKVLVMDNGIFGKGFIDFVKMYGGVPTLYTKDYDKAFDPQELDEYLSNNHDYKYATIVHHDTPTGMTNDVEKICPILKKYGILSVVDSVSAMIGEELDVDKAQIDILLGGSQKAISAPPGLTIVTISDEAKKSMESRKTPIASFYANLTTFKTYYQDKWFPYTMPISDIYGLIVAIQNIMDEPNIAQRHHKIAVATRRAVTECGLKLFAKNGYSNNNTVIVVPEGLTDRQIVDAIASKYQILISGSFDIYKGKLLRIGHMGENANIVDVSATLDALQNVLNDFGVKTTGCMKDLFLKYVSE